MVHLLKWFFPGLPALMSVCQSSIPVHLEECCRLTCNLLVLTDRSPYTWKWQLHSEREPKIMCTFYKVFHNKVLYFEGLCTFEWTLIQIIMIIRYKQLAFGDFKLNFHKILSILHIKILFENNLMLSNYF